MAHCSVYIATSVDGYIARHDGDMSWLEYPHYNSQRSSGFCYETFIQRVDAIVMGRLTYENIITQFDQWPYPETIPVIILSSRQLKETQLLKQLPQVLSGSPERVIEQIEAQGCKRIFIEGGVTVQEFLTADLINELVLTRVPILLGGGVPLFGLVGKEIPLQLRYTGASPNGFIQTVYDLDKN